MESGVVGDGDASGVPDDASARREEVCGPGKAPAGPEREAARQAARRAFDARVRDADVADLVYDSLIDTHQPSGMSEEVRRLKFVARDTSIYLDVDYSHEILHIALLVTPSRSTEAEVRADEEFLVVFFDQYGRAEFDQPRGSLISLIIPPAAAGCGRGLQTAWVRL